MRRTMVGIQNARQLGGGSFSRVGLLFAKHLQATNMAMEFSQNIGQEILLSDGTRFKPHRMYYMQQTLKNNNNE
jgi:hypothetical protein